MSFLKRMFGGDSKKPDSGPLPTRPLKLQFPPLPENGPKLAQLFVLAVKHNEKIDLDYSPGTLGFVDKFLQRFRQEGLTVDDFAETLFVAGSYVGQVMINNNDGAWIKEEEAKLPKGVTMMPIIVKLPNGTISDPIAKAFKRFYFGEVESLEYFYHVFTKNQ